MNKKILFGSIFVLTLILLMPSIPAIQQKTIEDKAYSDLIEEFRESFGADNPGIFKNLKSLKENKEGFLEEVNNLKNCDELNKIIDWDFPIISLIVQFFLVFNSYYQGLVFSNSYINF